MHKSVFLDARVEITPWEFSNLRSTDGLKEALVEKLKRTEGKCNANGYVKPGSIQLLARSSGAAENGKFTSNWIFDCKYSCQVLKPVAYDSTEPNAEASVLTVKVIKVNKMGAYAVFEEAIRVLMPRDNHVGDPAFEMIREGDTVRVRMEKHRYQTNDAYILAVGSLYKPEGVEFLDEEDVAEGATGAAVGATAGATEEGEEGEEATEGEESA
jgi:hypothetical protein